MNDGALTGALLAIDPSGLGGAILRGPARPERDSWLSAMRALLPQGTPVRRLPARIDDERLLGGLDVSASLAAGRPVIQPGLLAEADGGVVVIPMAERLDGQVAARFCGALDTREVVLERDALTARAPARLALVIYDEGQDESESAAEPLADRVAFRLDITSEGEHDPAYGAQQVTAARLRLSEFGLPDSAIVEALCVAAMQFGITSLRAPLFALKAARAHAALHGRLVVGREDAAVAARLVLAPRARSFPPDQSQPAPPPPDSGDDPAPAETGQSDPSPLDGISETVVEAVRASLPPGLLDGISAASPSTAQVRSRGAGAQAKSASRGRPAGVRPGRLGSGARLNLVETLRAAAPWQRLRRGDFSSGEIKVRPSDFRLQKFVQRQESTTVFAVDASGSTALQRLAEAKGAVELLLARAYVTRARVALIAFRGLEAELLLPPTRSLARARARLAALPGGGGTPLASALDIALVVALAERKRGATPQIVVLTDGRANIARGGVAGREAAEADARAAARMIGEAKLASVFIDTAARPAPGADRFARAMGGAYCHLPYVDARSLADAIGAPSRPRR